MSPWFHVASQVTQFIIALVNTRPSDTHMFSVGYLTLGICKDSGGHESHEQQPRPWLLLGTDPDMAHRHSLGLISTMTSCSRAGYPDLLDIGLAWSPDTNIATGDYPYPGLLYSLLGTMVMYINTELN